VTPSVTAPSDTNFSDATDWTSVAAARLQQTRVLA